MRRGHDKPWPPHAEWGEGLDIWTLVRSPVNGRVALIILVRSVNDSLLSEI